MHHIERARINIIPASLFKTIAGHIPLIIAPIFSCSESRKEKEEGRVVPKIL